MNEDSNELPAKGDGEEREREPGDVPRIYVASLSDYNAGRLHGAWIDAAREPDEIHEDIQAMLQASREPIAEEWAIHDYDGFGPLHLDEFTSVDNVSTIARGIAEHGRAFANWANYLGPSQWEHLDRFEDCYLGTWSSAEEFAASMLEDMGIDVDDLGPEYLQPYIRFDLDAFAHDLSHDFYMAADIDGVHIFDLTL